MSRPVLAVDLVLSGQTQWCLFESDALEALKRLPDRSVDAVVTDPPSGIAFMNAEWDKDKGGRDKWIAWLSEIFIEVRRIIKPGGHALVWALPRTSHWTATAVENAGWEIRDVGVHLFGSGFPKSLDVSKAIDAANGDERPVVGQHPSPASSIYGDVDKPSEVALTSAASAASAAWSGWGTALKPAAEHWILARAPFSERTVARNVLAHGTGGLHIDACRVGYVSEDDQAAAAAQRLGQGNHGAGVGEFGLHDPARSTASLQPYLDKQALGRWPANVTLEHAEGCRAIGPKRVRSSGYSPGFQGEAQQSVALGEKLAMIRPGSVHVDPDGTEVVESWSCAPGCPVKLLDEQSGDRPGMSGGGVHRPDYGGGLFGGIDSPGTARGDIGGASRFFYTAKPATLERERGCAHLEARTVDDGREVVNDTPRQRGATKRKNVHPTVKSIALMRWLCRLITPPGGVVLDCFAGSGTTIVAALAENFRAIGIEQSAEFCGIARARVEGDAPLLNRAGGGP